MKEGRKPKIKIDYGIRDYYKYYKSRYIQRNPAVYGVSQSVYGRIISDFNKQLADLIVEYGQDIRLSGSLGTIGLRKYKPVLEQNPDGTIKNNLPINYKETNKLWEKNPEAKSKRIYIRHTNKHTDGYVFTLHWFQKNAKFKNKFAYKMVFKRDFKRYVAQQVKLGIIDAFLLG
jgi:hypothetical protein